MAALAAVLVMAPGRRDNLLRLMGSALLAAADLQDRAAAAGLALRAS
jgi:hypothetical protein